MNDAHGSEVIVVGAGLAGLTAANYVAKAGHTVTLYEAKNRLGGRALTDERRGFFLNQGPHALYQGGAASSVLDELGIEVSGAKPPLDGRFLFDGELLLAPGGPVSLLRTKALGARAKVQFGKALGSLPKLNPTDFACVSAAKWVEDFVSDERARGLVRALVRLTTYGAALEEMSADLAVSQLQLGLADGVRYLDHGWQPMVDSLTATALATGRVRIESGCKVTELPTAKCVILALNSPQAVSAMTGVALEVGPPALTASLDLGLSSKPELDFVLGGQQPLYYSNHSAAATLAPEGKYLVSVAAYLGGNGPGAFPDTQDEPFDRRVLDEFAATCGVTQSDVIESRYLRRMVASSTIPTVSTGGMAGRPDVDAVAAAARSGTPTEQMVLVAGDWVGPEGHLADASMASAKRAAAAAVSSLS